MFINLIVNCSTREMATVAFCEREREGYGLHIWPNINLNCRPIWYHTLHIDGILYFRARQNEKLWISGPVIISNAICVNKIL